MDDGGGSSLKLEGREEIEPQESTEVTKTVYQSLLTAKVTGEAREVTRNANGSVEVARQKRMKDDWLVG